jgi:transaldolase
MNPLKALTEFGQSVYVDEIRRGWLTDGTLQNFIRQDGVHGVTSNPAIFEKAIAQTDDYDEAIAEAVKQGKSVEATYEDLVIYDIQQAADLFREQYEASDGRFGYISLEVSPKLAHDTEGTVQEARYLWRRLDRPNVFIKVPATKAGLGAIKTLISEGINVNVTLIFGLARYREVIEAYLQGLEARLQAGQSVKQVYSVASFFLSRIDVLVDPKLEQTGAPELRGKVAVAQAKVAYQIYREIFEGDRFAALAQQGARPQPLLWASTGVKNPNYQDTMYVEPLIGKNTINTMPTSTMDAYRDHGQPAERIEEGVDAARALMNRLGELGIDMAAVSQQLEDEGVDKFIQPFESLMATLKEALETTPA